MIERLEIIAHRYEEINNMLMQPEIISDIKKTLELTKEQSSLSETYETYQEYKKILNAIKDAEEMLDDPEMGEFAKEELDNLEQTKEGLEQK